MPNSFHGKIEISDVNYLIPKPNPGVEGINFHKCEGAWYIIAYMTKAIHLFISHSETEFSNQIGSLIQTFSIPKFGCIIFSRRGSD